MAVPEDHSKTPVHVVEKSDFDLEELFRTPFPSVEEATAHIKQQNGEFVYEIEREE